MRESSIFASRIFTPADQIAFAAISGDVNPMHLDPVAARRTQAGAPVVHGIHALLWALETVLASESHRMPVKEIEAQFQKFIYVDSPVAICIVSESDDAIEVLLRCDGLSSAVILVTFGTMGEEARALPEYEMVPNARDPLPNELKDLADMSGRLSQLGAAEIAEAELRFPRTLTVLGTERLHALLLISNLVGMISPGLNSIFDSLVVRTTRIDTRRHGLDFRVSRVHERFRRVEMEITATGIVGDITAFLRIPPVPQPGIPEISRKIAANEFRGITALIIGGSRGLGSVVAKAIAAGGGRTIITYAVGRLEAESVRNEIIAECGSHACYILRYDVRESFDSQMSELGWKFNQLYYFATPQIFRQSAVFYTSGRLSDFLFFYVEAFYTICSGLRGMHADDLAVFYPSTVALDQRPKGMTEYTMAKAAGEVLCHDMNEYVKGIRVVTARLPRVLTDQSATIVPADAADVLEIMLPIIREMHLGNAARNIPGAAAK